MVEIAGCSSLVVELSGAWASGWGTERPRGRGRWGVAALRTWRATTACLRPDATVMGDVAAWFLGDLALV